MIPEEGTNKEFKRYVLASVSTIVCSTCSQWIVYGVSDNEADTRCYDCNHLPEGIGHFTKWIFPVIKNLMPLPQ
jgi:hypothetical protein